jgi:membrane protease YdiL (CAAX protease family)
MKPNLSIGIQLSILIGSVFFCIIIASLLSGATLHYLGIENLDLSNPTTYLISGFYSQLIGFIGGYFLYLTLTKQTISESLHFEKPLLKLVFIVVGLLIISFPIMTFFGYLNSFLKELIPNNTFILEEAETDTYQLALLTTKGNVMLLLKLFVVAVLPAIGEELVFRGVILTKIRQASNNEHYGVIVSALIFAAIHLQPTKLLPMIFLGLVLGYIYTKTKNIIYPMLFHFLFNGTTILLAHFGQFI